MPSVDHKVFLTSYEDIPLNTSKEEILSKHDLISKTFLSNRTLSIDYRLEQLRNVYFAILDNREFLKEALYKDFHRPYDETEILEIHGIVAEIDEIINNLPKWAAEESVWSGIKNMLSRPVVTKQPYGTVLIISPWNYPYFLAVNPIVTAIAAGNTVIWKPTEIAPHSSRALTKVLQSALDPSIFQVVNGSVEEATNLLNLKFDKIMLTGSTSVGKIVAQAAAKTLTPTLLELGGKSPVLVDRNTNLASAARRIAWGKFVNAGQTCVAPDYILVDKLSERQLIDELRKALDEFYPNLDKDSADFAHISNDRFFSRLQSLIETSDGKIEIVHGQADEKSRFLPPTIISGVKASDSLMRDELFGPVLPIITVNDISTEGVDFVVANHDKPLALYVFSDSKQTADDIFSRTRSGGAIWNDTLLHVGVVQVPFGGIGESGMGSYHGKYGFEEFSHIRTVLRQPYFADLLLKIRYPPYTKSKTDTLNKLSYPKVWYKREGPVRRSLIRRILYSKLWFVLAAFVGILFFL